ncbi:MAG: phytoene/squalene synthase family protein [Fimbriiglobus sp.]
MTTLADSYAYAHQVTRQAKSSFPLAFRLLPKPKRQAMTVLYAYMRLTDDLADGDAPDKPQALLQWREQLRGCVLGQHSHPLHPALDETLKRYEIQVKYLEEVICGMEMDLIHATYPTFDELRLYLYRVASVVGLACIPIWGLKPGFTWAEVEPPAILAGYAFQMTNILRDIPEDTAKGRIYLPQDELQTYRIRPPDWLKNPKAYRDFMQFQADRARQFYSQSQALVPLLSHDGRAIFGAMSMMYAGLLQRVVDQDYDVFTRRPRLSKLRKARILFQAWRRKRG